MFWNFREVDIGYPLFVIGGANAGHSCFCVGRSLCKRETAISRAFWARYGIKLFTLNCDLEEVLKGDPAVRLRQRIIVSTLLKLNINEKISCLFFRHDSNCICDLLLL